MKLTEFKQLTWNDFVFVRNDAYLKLLINSEEGCHAYSGFGLRYYRMPTNRIPILFFTLLNMFQNYDMKSRVSGSVLCVLEQKIAQRWNYSINKGKRK